MKGQLHMTGNEMAWFQVRLMARVHSYTVQCVIGLENRYQGMTYYIALSVTQIASWWMVVTLLAVLFNALIVLVIFLISFRKKVRSSVIARLVVTSLQEKVCRFGLVVYVCA